jgi:hypothetical protein
MMTKRASLTFAPAPLPPDLRCPACDMRLVYRETMYEGISRQERWDFFICHICGPCVYQSRTGELHCASHFHRGSPLTPGSPSRKT